jgi:hypothetical protein
MNSPRPFPAVPLLALVLCWVFFVFSPVLSASSWDLDRDRIPNGFDRDIDGDGIRNHADRNIDGGVVRTGPLRGRFVGDRLRNDHRMELDMDADGLDDDAASELDIDGDGFTDGELRENDIDGDGIADVSSGEMDIDGDGRADQSDGEIDIDGDGLDDGARLEFDIDGDGSANGLDPDIDGDGVANEFDTDLDGTGLSLIIDLLENIPGNPPAYVDDDLVASITGRVAAKVAAILGIDPGDPGLRVRVQVGDGGQRVSGLWRYVSPDNLQVWAKWCYPVSDPSAIRIFADYVYTGPYSGNPADYTNPDNYAVSEENRLYSGFGFAPVSADASLVQLISTPNMFLNWFGGDAPGFFTVPNEAATGFPPPVAPLNAALGNLPAFRSNPALLDFSGKLSETPGFPGVGPVIGLLRTVREVNLDWYGGLESLLLR